MKTYTFPCGDGEWDGTIDVELTDEEASRLESSMKEEHFHLDEDPEIQDIWQKVNNQLITETKEAMLKHGELETLREEYKNLSDDDIVSESLGSFKICFPNAFDWIKKG